MKSLKFDLTDLLAGLMFVAFGLIFGLTSWFDLDLGTARRMGPGYFPLLLSGVLLLLGLIIILASTRRQGEPVGALAWRGMALILTAPLVFGMTVRGLGFAPSVFLCTLIASFASVKMTPLKALILALCVTLFSMAAFSYGLGLPYPRLGPWIPKPIAGLAPDLSPAMAWAKGLFASAPPPPPPATGG